MTVQLTNAERVLWPAARFTKGNMVAYYERAAQALLPHVAGRPLTLGRFPGGVDARGFAQTECRGRPSWMATEPIRLRSGRVREYCVVEDVRSLLWVANQSAVELHAFLWRRERPDEPAEMLFDLDPGPGTGILDCAWVAGQIRQLLTSMGLVSFVKTSGLTGIHVHVPLTAGHDFARTKEFAREFAAMLVGVHPHRVTDRARRTQREGRVLIDWLANNPRRSTIAPYSLRAGDLPTVAMPLEWDELEAAHSPHQLVILPGQALARLERAGDPLAASLECRQRVPG